MSWLQSKDKLEDKTTPFFFLLRFTNRLQLKLWTQTGQWVLSAIDGMTDTVALASGTVSKNNVPWSKVQIEAEQAAAKELRRFAVLCEGGDE